MSIVNIPSPCHENVSAMKPSGNGFYCQSCTKIVVDFTKKTDAEILEYLNSRNGERTCGHFRNDQVKRRTDWPFEMVRFVAALALVFGSVLFMTSCHTDGESFDRKVQDSTKAADSIAKLDSGSGVYTGVVLCEPPSIEDSAKTDSAR